MQIDFKSLFQRTHIASGATDNFTYLTIALVFLLLTSALAESVSAGLAARIVQSATVVTLVLGIWSVRAKRVWFHTGLGFIAAILLVTLAGFIFDNVGLEYAHIGIMLGFFCVSVWEAVRQMLFSGPVTRDKIIGTLCIFLLLGIIWALLFILITMVNPHAFQGLEINGFWQNSFNDFIYFSFVTLTTLGFGDIVPLSPMARFLSYMEAIVGQFYIAILVASLVGVRIADIHEGNK